MMVSYLSYATQNSLPCMAMSVHKEYLEGRAVSYPPLGPSEARVCREPRWFSINVCPTEYFLYLLPGARCDVLPPVFLPIGSLGPMLSMVVSLKTSLSWKLSSPEGMKEISICFYPFKIDFLYLRACLSYIFGVKMYFCGAMSTN